MEIIGHGMILGTIRDTPERVIDSEPCIDHQTYLAITGAYICAQSPRCSIGRPYGPMGLPWDRILMSGVRFHKPIYTERVIDVGQ